MQKTLTKTISFKLKTDKEIEKNLDTYFIEFGKATNFFLKRMHEIRNEFFITLPKNNQKECICVCCKNRIKMIKKNISDRTFYFSVDEKTLKKMNDPEIKFDTKIYKIKPKASVCSYCFGFVQNDKFIRKQLYPSGDRKVENSLNVKNSARLSGTEFAMAFEQSKAILKSRKQQQAFWKSLIKKNEYFIQKNVEILENKKIKRDNKSVDARVTLPKSGKQRDQRYKHYDDKPQYKGKTIYQINKEIEKLKIQNNKLITRVSSFPYFNSNVIQLHNNQLTFLEDNKIRLSFGRNKSVLKFYGTDVENPKSAERYKEALKLIAKKPITYSHLIKKDGDFYLEYPMKFDVDVPEPNKNFRALGIDRGVKRLAVISIIDEPNGKPHDINFFKGDEVWKSRIKYSTMMKRLRGVRRKNRKMRLFGGKVKNVSRDIIQNISRDIVDVARQKMPVVIVMEGLKGLKEPKGGIKRKREAKLRFMISNFLYGQMQKAIEYKAYEAGVPVVYIDPRHTSQKCYKCGNTDSQNRKTQGFFQCTSCGHKMNADLNASINIANAFYDSLKNNTN
ncbi:MAG: IS200/IS605 family element transposase accessory protein TnpB [Candidatus Aenigmarchaeota archaeon]|nr:IS200/IS605 family element transposase accessory protein TnpB [Candidatus Aenigmarchaeota archaeon]